MFALPHERHVNHELCPPRLEAGVSLLLPRIDYLQSPDPQAAAAPPPLGLCVFKGGCTVSRATSGWRCHSGSPPPLRRAARPRHVGGPVGYITCTVSPPGTVFHLTLKISQRHSAEKPARTRAKQRGVQWSFSRFNARPPPLSLVLRGLVRLKSIYQSVSPHMGLFLAGAE